MANVTTVYDVKTVYSLDDRASSALAGIAGHADRASSSMGGLSSALGGLAGILSGGALFAGGKKAFIDFNASAENTKIAIAAITKMFDKNISFGAAIDDATKSFEHYREVAKASVGELTDFTEMHKAVLPTLLKTGTAMKDIQDIVGGAIVAAPVFNYNKEMSRLEIVQALTGQVTARDRMATQLVEQVGYSVDEFNRRTRDNPRFAVDVMKRALTSDALKEGARHFEKSYDGVFSTLTDNLKNTFGKIGEPLAKSITAEIQSWNSWIDKNPQAIAEFSSKFSTALMDGFAAVKSSVGFVIEHKDALIALGGLFAGAKVAGSIAGAVGSAGSLVGALSKATPLFLEMATGASRFRDLAQITSLATPLQTVSAGFGGLAGQIGLVTAGLGALYVGLDYLASEFDKYKKSDVVREGDKLALSAAIMGAKTQGEAGSKAFSYAREFGALGKGGEFDQEKFFAGALRTGMLGDEAQRVTKYAKMAFESMDEYEIRRRMGMVPDYRKVGDPKKNDPVKPLNGATVNNNFNIQRVDVQSDDPDRFIAQINDAARNAWRHKTSADSVIRGG